MPDKVGEALSHKWVGYFRLRVGDYRVIYLIDNSEHMVKIAAIGHRKEIYKRSPE
ncbi:type II toxin-antitoxin system RelE/ParE family toxin [Wolbachia endosymbiont of Drosophila tristis]|nr:type II toxin-antitoxin system RelE/ParE family toxin [Wolbachia endosymbiont of Drosophila tristis]MDE5064783.1 type II toxin-antitoxin system RelE/ParE family toxin [Wolbachia endosymbiont of Drosophila tristis]